MTKKLSRKEQYRKNQTSNRIQMFVVGGGLVLLAVALMFFISQQGSASSSAETSQRSVGAIPVEVDYPAPELALENVNGQQESLSDYRGSVVLVNNWATWCPPCKAEMPTLVEYYNTHAAEGFMIVAVEAGEPKEEVAEFVEQYQMPFAVWLDPNGDALRAFKNGSLPNSYVIDRDGQIRLAWTGEITLDALEEHVTPLLSE